jgi:peptidoglycan/LPS O-acetylase OafA/YrhL
LALFTPSRFSVAVVFGTLILVAPFLRCFSGAAGTTNALGYWNMATCLRVEGLLLGFGMAYLANLRPRTWSMSARISPWIIAASGTALTAFFFLPDVYMYRLGLTVLAFGLCAVLVFLVNRRAGAFASSAVVKSVALASYSVYLTHALVIHVAVSLSAAVPFWRTFVYFVVGSALIAGAGAAFYFAVEKTSIQLRDRWVPRRSRDVAAVPERITVNSNAFR